MTCPVCRRSYMKVTYTGVCKQCQTKVDKAVEEFKIQKFGGKLSFGIFGPIKDL